MSILGLALSSKVHMSRKKIILAKRKMESETNDRKNSLKATFRVLG